MVNIPFPPSVIVPTDDVIIRKQLRDLDQPACFFGEGPAERRERLSRALSKLDPETRLKLQEPKPIESNKNEGNELFYHEGSEELLKARYHIAEYSIRQCNERLDMARINQLEPLSTRLIPQQNLIERVRKIEDLGSYVDDDCLQTKSKTLTSCNFNPEATLVATSSRGGKCKLWSIPEMETNLVYSGHESGSNFITFNPKSGSQLSPESANLASCAMDGSISLWNLIDGSPVSQLSGPQKNRRISRVRYHPCGNYLASCCEDCSWRLWDLPSELEILHQEGHSKAVFDIAFHTDGSLAGSAGMDSYARIWDLRTGRSIQMLEGHTDGIRTIDFSPNGCHIATGSADNTVKIWNLRQRKLEYTIPAHISSVTTVMFEKRNGYFLATSSFDKTVKFWSNQTWAPIKTLDAYDDGVTKLDLSTAADFMVTCHFKYTKLWSVAAE